MARWERALGMALGVLILGNAAFYLGATRPLEMMQAGQGERLLSLQRTIRDLRVRGKAFEEQVRVLQEVEAFHAGFPKRRGLVRVTNDLHRLAAAAGVSVPGVSYQPEPLKEAALFRVKLTLSVAGPYAGVHRFLHEVEKRRQHLVIERMALAEQRGQATANQVAMQLTLAGYFR